MNYALTRRTHTHTGTHARDTLVHIIVWGGRIAKQQRTHKSTVCARIYVYKQNESDAHMYMRSDHRFTEILQFYSN